MAELSERLRPDQEAPTQTFVLDGVQRMVRPTCSVFRGIAASRKGLLTVC